MSSEQSKEPVMPSKQGDVDLLQDPVAQQLLQSKSLAHLASNWHDGTPRIVPIGFYWNGQEIVMATATDAPKTKVLRNGAKVAVSIEHDSSPPKILQIRGTVHTDTVEGLAPEYVASARRTLSEGDAQVFLAESARLYPPIPPIFSHPSWSGSLTFQP